MTDSPENRNTHEKENLKLRVSAVAEALLQKWPGGTLKWEEPDHVRDASLHITWPEDSNGHKHWTSIESGLKNLDGVAYDDIGASYPMEDDSQGTPEYFSSKLLPEQIVQKLLER